MAELFNAYAQGVQLGQQQRDATQKRNQLAELQSLAPQVIRGDMAATERAYALDPDRAKAYQGQQDRNRALVYNAARYLKGALDRNNPAEIAGAWRPVRTGLINAGIATEQDLSPDWQPEYAQTVHQALAMGDGGSSQTPTDVRSFQMMTQGLNPEDTERARRINLGLDGRASTSGFSQVKFTGADGRERLGVLNGRTGQIDLPDGTSFNPQTGAISQTAGMQHWGAQPAAQATVFRAPNGEVIDVSQVTEPGLRESIMQNPEQWGLVPDGGSAQLPPRNVSPAQAGGGMFVGRAPEEQAAATEAAKLAVQQQYLPQELQARSNAAIQQKEGETAVTARAEQANASRSNGAAARVYEQGMAGAMQGLAGASTGPVVGRLPALTADQQIAEGGVSAMAPVLKQMFRTAGEGSFTDKDQDLLMAMLPTRKDSPEARDVKAANVDDIVRAKLGMPAPQKAVNPQTGETLYLRFGQWMKH